MMETENVSNILEFLSMIGKLKETKRTGWVRKNIPECETVASHMYRMGIMAFLLNGSSEPDFNRDRCMKMALVHDMAECIVGDLTPYCGVSKEEKHKREVAAMEKLRNLAGKSGDDMFELFMEYEKQETSEAKVVKDFDKFDMVLQAFEYEKRMKTPYHLQGFFDHTEGTFQSPKVIKWVEELQKIRQEFHKQLCSKPQEDEDVQPE